MLKQNSKISDSITLVGRYMFNKYIALLPLSAFIPIYTASRIFNGIKYYCKFNLNGNLSWELIFTLLVTGVLIIFSTWFIYLSGKFISEQILKIYQEIKCEMIRIYREVYYPHPKKVSCVIKNIQLIFYSEAISLIKKSAYGSKAKYEAIKSGKLKETGGRIVTKISLMAILQAKEYQEYVLSTEDKIELDKEKLLYDLIFQEFCIGYGYLDKDDNLKKDILYSKTLIKIQENQLNEFLRVKELELQNELFNS